MNAPVKIGCLVAGMTAGADSIDDMDLLRHGALPAVFDRVRAPSTLGSFLRSFTWGNVRQLEKVSRNLLAGRARRTPLLPGADQLAFTDIDSIQQRVYGHAKQGAAFGHTKIQGKHLLVRGLNVLAATISTPVAAPVIAATAAARRERRLRRGAASFATASVAAARGAGCSGTLVARGIGVLLRGVPGACAGRGVPLRHRPDGPEGPRRDHRHRRGGLDADPLPPRDLDDQLRAWVFDAQVAEAAVHRVHLHEGAGDHRPADRPPRQRPQPPGRRGPGRTVLRLALPRRLHRLPVRDAPGRRAPPRPRPGGAGLRRSDRRAPGPPALGSFPANAAWLACAAISDNLLRAAGSLASLAFAKARGATLRRDLIDVAARTARHGRGHITLHLPEGWHREHRMDEPVPSRHRPAAAAA